MKRAAILSALFGVLCLCTSQAAVFLAPAKCNTNYQCGTGTGTPTGGFPSICHCDTTIDDEVIRFGCETASNEACKLSTNPVNPFCSGKCTDPGYTNTDCTITYTRCEAISEG